ncbi:MAG: hypothetical protein JNG88_15285 [Phycisphaerales bacterium]|nr:hypothetical protein [Phycisphaerales bacterium]
MATIDPELLEILACPVPECRAPLALSDSALLCTGCRRRYRIEQSWPVLIPEEAELPAMPSVGANSAEAGAASKNP